MWKNEMNRCLGNTSMTRTSLKFAETVKTNHSALNATCALFNSMAGVTIFELSIQVF